MSVDDRLRELEKRVEYIYKRFGLNRVPPETKKVVRGDEMTPDEMFNSTHAKLNPLNIGPIPVDGRGRVIDPRWVFDEETSEYIEYDRPVFDHEKGCVIEIEVHEDPNDRQKVTRVERPLDDAKENQRVPAEAYSAQIGHPV